MCSPSRTPLSSPTPSLPHGHPSAPALSTLSHTSNLDWQSVSHTSFEYEFRIKRPEFSFGLNHPQEECVCLVVQSRPTPCDPMDCSPPGSSVHGIFQARLLSRVPLPSPMFQCGSLKSSHPHLLPQNPKDCSLCLCLFCCLAKKKKKKNGYC